MLAAPELRARQRARGARGARAGAAQRRSRRALRRADVSCVPRRRPEARSGRSRTANDADVDGPEAWDVHLEGQDVTVGVVDMRIDGHAPGSGRPTSTPTEDFVGYDATCSAGDADRRRRSRDPRRGPDRGAARRRSASRALAPLAHVKPLRTLDNCGAGKLSGVHGGVRSTPATRSIPIVVGLASRPTRCCPPWTRRRSTSPITAVFADNPGTLYVVAAGNEGRHDDDRVTCRLPVQQRRRRT